MQQSMHQFVRECGSHMKAAIELDTNRQQIGRWLKLDYILLDGKVYAPVKRKNTDKQFEVMK